MTGSVHNSCEFDITSPSVVKERLAESGAPAGDVRFVIDSRPEQSEKPFHEDSFLGYNLSKFASGIEELLAGDEVRFETDKTDIYLTPVEKRDAVKIDISIEGVPDDVLDYKPDLVHRETLLIAVYSTLDEWHREALEINPELTNVEWFQEFERALDDAEQTLERAGMI